MFKAILRFFGLAKEEVVVMAPIEVPAPIVKVEAPTSERRRPPRNKKPMAAKPVKAIQPAAKAKKPHVNQPAKAKPVTKAPAKPQAKVAKKPTAVEKKPTK